MVDVELAGKKQDGTEFSLPKVTLDYCSTRVHCGPPGGDEQLCSAVCSDSVNSPPRSIAFQCRATDDFVTEGGFTGADGTGFTFWLPLSTFPSEVQSRLQAEFGLQQVPIISANPLDVVVKSTQDNAFDPLLPSVVELCVQASFVSPARPLGTPGGPTPQGTSPSSLTFGDCPGVGSATPEDCCNGVDDDGDGKVDFDDTDCCSPAASAASPLHVTVLTLAGSRKGGLTDGRMKLKSRLPDGPFIGTDPLQEDVSIQLRNGGQVRLCANIPAAAWNRPKTKPVFFFRDATGTQAAGLTNARIAAPASKKADKGRFSASGAPIDLSEFVAGPLDMGLRVGKHCATETIALTPKKNGLGGP